MVLSVHLLALEVGLATFTFQVSELQCVEVTWSRATSRAQASSSLHPNLQMFFPVPIPAVFL